MPTPCTGTPRCCRRCSSATGLALAGALDVVVVVHEVRFGIDLVREMESLVDEGLAQDVEVVALAHLVVVANGFIDGVPGVQLAL